MVRAWVIEVPTKNRATIKWNKKEIFISDLIIENAVVFNKYN
jgi:hypothetical protein